jgi:hypothetical protein
MSKTKVIGIVIIVLVVLVLFYWWQPNPLRRSETRIKTALLKEVPIGSSEAQLLEYLA